MSSSQHGDHQTLLAKLDDVDPGVRIDAAFELAQLGSRAGHDALIAALAHHDWQVRMRAASRLGRIGAAGAIGPVASLLGDAVSGVRNAAIISLLRIGLPGVVPHLLRALRDEDPDIREDASAALSSMLGKAAALELGDVIEEESVSRMTGWWADNSHRFDPDRVYADGLPYSLGALIDEFRTAPPDISDDLANSLFDLTGRRFTGSHGEQAAAWDAWWRSNQASFPAGRRYFHGRDVDELWEP